MRTVEENINITQAAALVAKWSKEYRAHLRDGYSGAGGSIHPAAQAALIDHISLALKAIREDMNTPPSKISLRTPSVSMSAPVSDAVLVNAVADAEPTNETAKPKRGRKPTAKAQA
jgi:hypothetical protein